MAKSKFNYRQENYRFQHPKSEKPESGKWETVVLFYQTSNGDNTDRIYCDQSGREGLKHLATAKGCLGPKNDEERNIHPQLPPVQVRVNDGLVFLTHMFDWKTAKQRQKKTQESIVEAVPC